MVFEKNSRSFFKNNDEATILAPERAEERSANSHSTSIARARKKLCLLGDPRPFGNPPARAKDVRRTLLPALLGPADAEREDDASAPKRRAGENIDAGTRSGRAANDSP